MHSVAHQIETLRAKLAIVCREHGRDPATIQLVAVTKTRTAEEVNEALAAGLDIIGENRVQEALSKLPDLKPCTKHFIGHLQTNKALEVVRHFDLIESVDSLRLAAKLDIAAAELGKILPIYLQANLAAETTKSGFAADELAEAAKALRALPHLELRGLMVIGPNVSDHSEISRVFRLGQTWREQLGLAQYSAGMSTDWPLAVAAGSTSIRIGSAIFGER